MNNLLDLIEQVSSDGFKKEERLVEVRMSYKNYSTFVKEVMAGDMSIQAFGNTVVTAFVTAFGNIKIIPIREIPENIVWCFSKRDGDEHGSILIKNINLVTNEVETKKKSGRHIEIGDWS